MSKTPKLKPEYAKAPEKVGGKEVDRTTTIRGIGKFQLHTMEAAELSELYEKLPDFLKPVYFETSEVRAGNQS